MAMTSPEPRPSPEKTRPSRDPPSSSRPVKSPPSRRTAKASTKPKAAVSTSKPTLLKRKRAVDEDSESDDPLAGPQSKVLKRTKKPAGLSSKVSTRIPVAVVENDYGGLNIETANDLDGRASSQKSAPKQTRPEKDTSAGIFEEGMVGS